MLNTLGAVGGYIVAPALLILFPSKERVKEKASRIFQEKTVRPTAQLLALLIDYIVVMMSWFIVSMLLRMYDPMTKMLFMLLGFFVLQYLMPLYTRGKTLGTRLLRFHFAKNYNERWAKVLFRRWIALVAPWFIYKLIHFIIKYATLDMNLPYYAFQIFLELGLSLLIFLMLLIIVIHGATVLMSRQDKPFYFDELSGVIARYDQR